MKKLFSLLFALLAVTMANAQILKGDMNGDGQITMADANEVANTYLGKKAVESVSTVDNSRIQGTWYETKTKTVNFNTNGTTDYTSCTKYGYYPELKALIFFDKAGKLLSFRNILTLTDQEMSIDNGGATVNYTRTKPVYKVTSITISTTRLDLATNGYAVLTATVLPADADNKSVTWESTDESVAIIIDEGRIIPMSIGSCTILCKATDGSGVYAKCAVNVSNATSTHEYVDLGLSVKWATCNVGASKPEEYGDYFAWGETEGYNSSKKSFSWSTYKWCSNGTWTGMTKYTYPDNQTDGIWYSGSTFIGDRKTVLDKVDDAASVNWGGSWRMPTTEEQDELCNNCNWTWTTLNGVYGIKVESKNGNSIFLPAAGFRGSSSLGDAGSYGGYWSSSLSTSYSDGAYGLDFSSSNFYSSSNFRYNGLSVRAVCP